MPQRHETAVTTTPDIRPTLRLRAFEILEHGRRGDFVSRIIDSFLVVVILANVAAVVAQTLPDISPADRRRLQIFDWICVLIFVIEYGARIWLAPEHPLLQRYGAFRARLRFAATPLMVIDALALLPWLLELIWPQAALLRLTRLVRFLKLARYSPALASIGRVISAERRALLACIIILSGALLTAAAVMLTVEGHAQPDKLGDMPKAMWWAASMLAKIGGGEIAPVTALGQIVSAITVMLGIFCFALPVAILGRGFYEEIRRRDFVVTFAMVARVPLFADLDSAAIADLVGMLQSRTVAAGATIVHKGERGDTMFLIASGAVDVLAATGPVRLDAGDVFGEMALISREPRSATVIAAKATDLLVLEASDFLSLAERNPDIQSRLQAVMRKRLLDNDG